MVSMKDIASVCGVSVATVSKALNNQSDISAETKKRVAQVAKELGYFPNQAAKALKTNRSYNIGVLFVDEDHSGLTHDYFSVVLDSFKTEAEDKGYDITFINSSKSGPRQMSFLEHARSKGFDGVVIACINFDSPDVLQLVQSGIPIVTVDYVFNSCTSICSNNIQGMSELVRYVYKKGHRKIAYIHGEDSAVTRNRLSSFYRTAAELGLEIPDGYVLESAYRNTARCESLTYELLDRPDPPTCILYSDDFACIGGVNAIRNRGLSIPQDISIAGYDGIPLSRYLNPQLTTLYQDTREMGKRAAKALIDMIEHPKTTLIEQIVIDGYVLEGESVANI